MSNQKNEPRDHMQGNTPANRTEALELGVAKLLRVGVLVAGALLALSWLLSLRGGNPLDAFRTYAPVTLPRALGAAWQERDVSLLVGYAGLFVLVSLPPLRVLFTAILLVRTKERLLAGIALFVLAVLAASFALGWKIS